LEDIKNQIVSLKDVKKNMAQMTMELASKATVSDVRHVELELRNYASTD